MTNFMLSTEDNPFNPYTEFKEWLTFDTRAGYHSLSLLARVVQMSYALSDPDQQLAIQQGIDEIVRENVSGMHVKVPQPKGAEQDEQIAS